MNVKDLADQMIEAVREFVARALQPIEQRLAQIEARPAPEKGDKGEPGRDGIDGKSATVEELQAVADAWFAKYTSTLRPPQDGAPGRDGVDGKSVTLEDVRQYLDTGLAVIALEAERRFSDQLQRALDRLVQPKDGAPGRDGRDGKDGRDGLGVEDFEASIDGRTLTLTVTRGDFSRTHKLRIPAVLDAGVYREGATYEQGDGVTFGGSFWIAQKDAPAGKPGASADWRLAVKKGRDGSDK